MPQDATKADLQVAHFTNRKVTRIVEQTYAEFRRIIKEYETLSADEIFEIGVNLMMHIMVRPLEKMSDRPSELRKEVAQQLMLMIEKGTEEGN